MKSIPFNIPFIPANKDLYLDKVFAEKKFSGDGEMTKLCNKLIGIQCNSKKVLLTTSCTHALEMSAILSDIKEGDEIIMSSFTFVSTANAFILRGAKIIFVDIHASNMNINESLIQPAITSKTKAIVVMHYGGVACNMEKIGLLCKKFNLILIEDAAQGLDAYYFEKPLGSMGQFGTLSFHETKNVHCGEGGALLINDESYIERAEIIREKGTDRSKFLNGLIDKYTWVDIGSSYLPGEINAAILLSQLNILKKITKRRLHLWGLYNQELKILEDAKKITLPFVPFGCTHNGHLFYLKCKNINERHLLMDYLKSKRIQTAFHYIPLHSSKAGKLYSSFSGKDIYTTSESERLLRLPLYYNLSEKEVLIVCREINNFYLNL